MSSATNSFLVYGCLGVLNEYSADSVCAVGVLCCRTNKRQEVDNKAAVEAVTSEWEARLAAATKALVDLKAELVAVTKERDESLGEKQRLTEELDRWVWLHFAAWAGWRENFLKI